MQCPACKAMVIVADARHCQVCGTRLPPLRVRFGAKDGEFFLTPDEGIWELGTEEHTYKPPAQPLFSRSDEEEDQAEREFESDQVRWGGFFRRAFAFLIDLVVVCIFSAVLFALCFIGYKVGLAAHDRAVSLENSHGLIVLLTAGWVFFVTSYFVVFHGIDGQTIGKWLLRLRVTGENGTRVT
jgi:hypothetical protein